MDIYFVRGDSMTVQGKYNEVYKKYGKEWNIKEEGKGNGNWLLTKRNDVIIDGKSYRDFILNHYGKQKLTENLANTFIADVKNGKIKI